MLLIKNKGTSKEQRINLTNQIHVSAFLRSGWEEVSEFDIPFTDIENDQSETVSDAQQEETEALEPETDEEETEALEPKKRGRPPKGEGL